MQTALSAFARKYSKGYSLYLHKNVIPNITILACVLQKSAKALGLRFVSASKSYLINLLKKAPFFKAV